jgi:16S rRNA (adenine1518-N6/adenine1519-N6)-dimethyltransferase
MDRDRRRKFGQNFLINQGMISDIASDAPPSEAILEIGPGHGAITRYLLQKTPHLTCVDIDELCIQQLKSSIGSPPLNLVHEDFLKFDLDSYVANHKNACVVGNLPYNVATPILLKIFPHLQNLKGIMAMVQLEAAERFCAKPGTHSWGVLSVILNCYGKAHILRKVGPENFEPKPNVMSATMWIEYDENACGGSEEFFDFLGLAFSQKRKVILNPLSQKYPKDQIRQALLELNLGEKTRAEEISAPVFKELWQKFI